MLMRNLILVTVCLAVAVGICGCGDSEEKGMTIAVIPKGTTHDFWNSIHAGAEKAARELDVEIIWEGPLKEDDRSGQIDVVENMINRGVSGIVLAPLDENALARPVAEAAQSGIPVVIIDSGLAGEDFVSFVATDNHKGGMLGGRRLAKLLGGKGKVILLRYQEGSASTMKREQGFMDAMAENDGIEVVSSNRYAGATAGSAQDASDYLLDRFTDESGKLLVDGIFCPNESSTAGMLMSLRERKLAGKVRFVGFDGSERLVGGLRKGEIHGLVLQNPMLMGYLGVKTMVQHLRGEKIPDRVDTGVTVATPENMAEPAIKELLNPDLDKWLK